MQVEGRSHRPAGPIIEHSVRLKETSAATLASKHHLGTLKVKCLHSSKAKRTRAPLLLLPAASIRPEPGGSIAREVRNSGPKCSTVGLSSAHTR